MGPNRLIGRLFCAALVVLRCTAVSARLADIVNHVELSWCLTVDPPKRSVKTAIREGDDYLGTQAWCVARDRVPVFVDEAQVYWPPAADPRVRPGVGPEGHHQDLDGEVGDLPRSGEQIPYFANRTSCCVCGMSPHWEVGWTIGHWGRRGERGTQSMDSIL